jgi:hypothetical protein
VHARAVPKVLHCCLLQVKVGLEEVAADLFRVKPYVYSAPDNSAVIVFSGALAPARHHASCQRMSNCRFHVQLQNHILDSSFIKSTLSCYSDITGSI